MNNIGYYNGEIAPIESLSMPITDRAAYFGDGCYDATYVYNDKVLFEDEHIDRFFNGCRLLKIDFPYTKDELHSEIQRMLKEFDRNTVGFLYFQTSRGTGLRKHVFPEKGKANLMMYVTRESVTPMDEVFKLITLEDTRFLHCNIKTLNLLPSVLANQAAKEAGCDEAILHRGERVTECAHSNVSILTNGVLKTAPTDCYILPGIARAHLIKAACALGYGVDETPFTVEELMNADEIIVTSSGTICTAASEIDGKTVGGKAPEMLGELKKYLADEFNNYMGAEIL